MIVAASRKIQEVSFQCDLIRIREGAGIILQSIIDIFYTGSISIKTDNAQTSFYYLQNVRPNVVEPQILEDGYSGFITYKGSLNLVKEINVSSSPRYDGYIYYPINLISDIFKNLTSIGWRNVPGTHWNRLTGTLDQLDIPSLVNMDCQDDASTLLGELSDNMINLEYLRLALHNNITRIPEIMIKLSYVEIGGNNTISQIPTTFTNLTYLTILGNNTISEISETFTNLTHLNIVGQNTISEIPDILTNLDYLNIGGSNTISEIPNTLINLTTVVVNGQNTLTYIPNTLVNLSFLNIVGQNTISEIPDINTIGRIIITGNNTISEIPNTLINLYELRIDGLNTISEIPDTLINLLEVRINGSNTISEIPNITGLNIFVMGNTSLAGVSSIPQIDSLSQLRFVGNVTNNTFSSIPILPNLNIFDFYRLTQLELDLGGPELPSVDTLSLRDAPASNCIYSYTSGKIWPNGMVRVTLMPTGSGLSSTEVDNLLIDLAISSWTSTLQIQLTGTNAPRTSASDDAVAILVSKGVTVTTN